MALLDFNFLEIDISHTASVIPLFIYKLFVFTIPMYNIFVNKHFFYYLTTTLTQPILSPQSGLNFFIDKLDNVNIKKN